MTEDRYKILIVEDERDLAAIYAGWLSEHYSVQTAYDGEEALDRLDESIDVVLLDRRLPRRSGDEVLKAIREDVPECRVAMVTAVEPDFDIIGMGFDDYLMKPFSREDILDTVDRLVIRNQYNDKLDEYEALIAKKIALESEKTDQELEESAEFRELKARIDSIKESIDPMVQEFEEDDIAAVLRDLPASSP